jgi:hypothetical protein
MERLWILAALHSPHGEAIREDRADVAVVLSPATVRRGTALVIFAFVAFNMECRNFSICGMESSIGTTGL